MLTSFPPLAILCVIFVVASTHPSTTTAQAPPDTPGRVLAAIAAGDSARVAEVLRSTSFDVRQPIVSDWSALSYALLQDHLGVLRAVAHHALPLQPEDLGDAALLGRTEHFLAILRMGRWRTLEELVPGGAVLFPFSDSARASLRTFIRDARPGGDEEDEWEDEERRDADTVAIARWIERLERHIAPAEVAGFLQGVAVAATGEERVRGRGSEYLLRRYFFPDEGPLGDWYAGEFLARAFEQGQWRVVDHLLLRGADGSGLLEVRPHAVRDVDRALGYFLRGQLLDLDPTHQDAARNRAWRIPAMSVSFQGNGGRVEQKPLVWDAGWQALFGSLAIVEGTCQVLSMSGQLPSGPVNGQVGLIRLTVNASRGDVYARGCQDPVWVVIPASDSLSRSEFHSVEIENYWGPYPNDPLLDPIRITRITRDGELIKELRHGEKALISRARGPIVVSQTMRAGPGAWWFGMRFVLAHTTYPKLAETDPVARLNAYHALAQAQAATRLGEQGQGGTVLDARTTIRLVSEQLYESGVHNVVEEGLRVALKTLGEQSQFDAAFTEFVLDQNRLLGFKLPDVLRNIPADASPSVREEIERLRASADRQAEMLRLLSLQSVVRYEGIAGSVESLMYELAQYYDREALREVLARIGGKLGDQRRASLRRNVRESSSLFNFGDDSMEGKGAEIRAFLGLR